MLRLSLNRQRLVVGVGLSLLVAISWWSTDVLELADDSDYLMAGQPDYFMRDLEVLVQDHQGAIKHKLLASELAYFPHPSHTQFEDPMVAVYRDNQVAWLISAERGSLSNQKLDFDDGVMLHRGENAGATTLQMQTEAMAIDLASKQAWSDGQVRVWQAGLGEMQGVGMRIDLNENQLQLQSQVRVRYENN